MRYTERRKMVSAVQFADNTEAIQEVLNVVGKGYTVAIRYNDPYNPILHLQSPGGIVYEARVGEYVVRRDGEPIDNLDIIGKENFQSMYEPLNLMAGSENAD